MGGPQCKTHFQQVILHLFELQFREQKEIHTLLIHLQCLTFTLANIWTHLVIPEPGKV